MRAKKKFRIFEKDGDFLYDEDDIPVYDGGEEDWDDLGYDDGPGVDDDFDVLDGEDYSTYGDMDYLGMNDGERAYSHYDGDMEDIIADSMPTRKKALFGKDSEYFNPDYKDSPDIWDGGGDFATLESLEERFEKIYEKILNG